MKYGIYYAYWAKQWGVDYVPFVEKVKKCGFDVLEISCAGLKDVPAAEIARLKAAADDQGILLTGGYGPKASENIASADPAVAEAAGEIVAYLNARIGTRYKPKSKGTLKHVSARLREGYTVDDFKTVIDKKCADWRNDPRMAPYLRPETLFGPKFEGYLNEIEIRGGVADGRYDKYR